MASIGKITAELEVKFKEFVKKSVDKLIDEILRVKKKYDIYYLV